MLVYPLHLFGKSNNRQFLIIVPKIFPPHTSSRNQSVGQVGISGQAWSLVRMFKETIHLDKMVCIVGATVIDEMVIVDCLIGVPMSGIDHIARCSTSHEGFTSGHLLPSALIM